MPAICLPPIRTISALPPMPSSDSPFQSMSISDLGLLHELVQATFGSNRIAVNHVEDLPNHLHRIRTLCLSDGSRVILKIQPPVSVPMLKHERLGLETEALVLHILARSGLSVPVTLRFEGENSLLGHSFLLTTHIPGVSFASALPRLSRNERISIDRQISTLGQEIGRRQSSSFGPVLQVSLRQGYRTWREAFKAMLENVLKDAEDLFVNLPYSLIRERLVNAEYCLDEVREARLVVPGLGNAHNVLIDERTKEITGLVDFKQALWGDIAMADEDGAPGTRGLL